MATRSFSVTVIRPKDLLLLRLDFLNIEDGVAGEIGGGPQAGLIVHFQPQHVAEQAFFEGPKPETPLPPGQVNSRMAGPSRLVFRIPPGEQIKLTLPEVLEALKRLPLVVPAVASYETPLGCLLPPFLLRLFFPPPTIAAPTWLETAIEAPYRLFLSPDAQGSWDHAAKAVDHGSSRVELWHTRLGTHRADNDPRLRAVWSPDFQEKVQGHANEPFRMSLDANNRNQIVQATSNYHINGFTPTPVQTERLMLSTLGAWIDVHGRWDPGTGLSIEEWRHIATMGRDHFVRVVEAGYLFPFGHRAVLVTITERKFVRHDLQLPGFVAYNLQRKFIIVREPSRDYDTRNLPFRNVEILTRVTPDLADPKDSEVTSDDKVVHDAFWPQVGGGDGTTVDFLFRLAGTDWEGRRIEFTAPLIFVDKIVEESAGQRTVILDAYNKPTDVETPRRERPFDGQYIAFAVSKDSGDTTLETKSISFGADTASTTPHFRPTMVQARVDIPAVQQLTNTSVSSRIKWEGSYLTGPGTAIGNAANIYARVVDKPGLKFAAQQSGGLVTPDLSITGLSRSLGPVGGNVDNLVQPTGKFVPAEIFGDPKKPADPTLPVVELMGGIALSSIIQDLAFDNAASTAGAIPQLRTLRNGNLITTSYLWSLTRAQMIESALFLPEDSATFLIEAEVQKRLDSTDPPAFRTHGKLTNFGVKILPDAALAQLNFNSVSFTAEPGKKLDTDVDLKGIEFLGILQFVDQLREIIPMDGFSDPPSLDVGSDGVRVGFSVGIPTVGVGVMTMQNISLSAGFFLPFNKEPMNFRFAFCERHQPFTLTVSALGGGGFVAVNLGLKGVKSLEAALEFGASVALNLGVAAGAATIMAGFYFQMGADNNFQLTGYFRACGELSVLGIISVSVEFYLGLSYAPKGSGDHGGKLWGQASLTVKIKIAFFSKSVGISMEKVFAGSDPNFRDLLKPPDWALYCDSFADYLLVAGD